MKNVPKLVHYSLSKPLHICMVRSVSVVLTVRFFASEVGNEPVREWLKELGAQDRKTIGEEIKTVQIGWPLGMPLVRKWGRTFMRCELRYRIGSGASCSL